LEYEDLLTLFRKVGELKTIKRSGWVRCEIPNPESVADHSFRCAFMAMVLGDMMDVDSEKLMRMALLHDIAEAVSGDITPHDGISRNEKSQREVDGLQSLLEGIQNSKQYIALWKEYEEGESIEARLAQNIDKLEMAIQAVEYQKRYPDIDLSQFVSNAQEQIDLPEIMELFKEIQWE
jgi:5'-deoxynucleotidase YfbR-like HD superfamily hydrolase